MGNVREHRRARWTASPVVFARMRALLVGMLSVASACNPAARHEVSLDITNNRDEVLVVRIVPEIRPGEPIVGRTETGVGGGYEVAPGQSVTLPLAVMSDRWTVTVNGAPVIRSSDSDVGERGQTRARLAVDRDEQFLEVIPAEADSS